MMFKRSKGSRKAESEKKHLRGGEKDANTSEVYKFLHARIKQFAFPTYLL